MSMETRLREALAARADDVQADPADPYERVAGAIVAHRRRRRGVAVGAVAAACAVAVAVPLLGQGQERTAPPARQTRTTSPLPTDPALWRSMRTWPTRGELAGDTAFVEAVTAQVAPEGNALFASDLGRYRVVVLWVPSEDPSMPHGMLRVATGPLGAGADALAVEQESAASSADAVVFREGSDGAGRLVVLTRPTERRAELSDGVEISPDGTVSRTWERLPLTDGLGTAQPRAPLSLNRIQVGAYDGPVTLTAGTAPIGPRPDGGAGICLDCSGQEFRERAEDGVRDSVAQSLGVATDEVATTTRYSGPVGAAVVEASGITDAKADGARHTLYVGDTTLRRGGVLRSVLLVSSLGDGTGSVVELASGVPIDAATAARRPVVIGGARPSGKGAVIEVFAPGAGSVRLVSEAPSLWPDAGAVLNAGRAPVDLADAQWRQHYAIEPYDPAGRPLGTFPVDLPNATDPFDLQPGG